MSRSKAIPQMFANVSSQWGRFSVGGRSVKWNQLIDNGDFQSSAGWSVSNATSVSYSNGELSFQNTSTASAVGITKTGFVATSGRKAVFSVEYKMPSTLGTNFVVAFGGIGLRYEGTTLICDGQWHKLDAVTSFIANNAFVMYIRPTTITGASISIRKMQIIDLTSAFGSGNEPTTIDAFYATPLGKLVKSGKYLEYNPQGGILNATTPFYFYKNTGKPEMASLLGKHNATASFDQPNTSFYPTTSGGYITYYTNAVKTIHRKANHKYFFVIKANVSYDWAYLGIWDTGSSGYSGRVAPIDDGDFHYAVINSTTDAPNAVPTPQFGGTGATTVYYEIILDLTELGLDSLTAQQFYDEYKNDFGKLANGQTVNGPTVYEPLTEIGSVLGRQNTEATFSETNINMLIFPTTGGSFNETGTGGKSITTENHKYFIYTKLTGLPAIAYPSRCYLRNSLGYVGGTDMHQTADFICFTVDWTKGGAGSHYLMFNVGSTQTLTLSVSEMLIIDLTELGKDSMTAQAFYDEYRDKLPTIANGDSVRALLTLRGNPNWNDKWHNATGRVERKTGSVDLGTLTYSKSGNNFQTTGVNDYKYALNNNTPINAVIPNYRSVSYNQSFVDYDFAGIASGSRFLYFRNSTIADATAFKASLDGVHMDYELATPTAETADSLMLPRNITKCIDANGIELEITKEG